MDLPPPIGFDISEEAKLPDPQQTFLCSPDGQEVVRQFLEQYFLLYDSESRQPLLNAYHQFALFSMTMAYPYSPYGQNKKGGSWLEWYANDNRNLLRVIDADRRLKLLLQGQGSIITFLEEMPDTKHDVHSFTVDLSLFTVSLSWK